MDITEDTIREIWGNEQALRDRITELEQRVGALAERPDTDPLKLYNMTELADLLGVARGTITRWQDRLPLLRAPDGRPYVMRKDLEAWLEERKQ